MTVKRFMRQRRCNFAITASIFLMLQGCAESATLPLTLAAAQQGLEAYRLGPGDKLRITVYNEPNLSGEYAVSSSGEVSFPLIGLVKAADFTVADLTQFLAVKLSDGYMTDPRVSVEVLNYRPYYILGEVQRPGEYPYVAGMTMEQAVAVAGGFRP